MASYFSFNHFIINCTASVSASTQLTLIKWSESTLSVSVTTNNMQW